METHWEREVVWLCVGAKLGDDEMFKTKHLFSLCLNGTLLNPETDGNNI